MQAAWLYKLYSWYSFATGSVGEAPYWSGIRHNVAEPTLFLS